MKSFKIILFFIVLSTVLPAHATYICTGPVEGLTISPKAGTVLAQKVAGFTWPVICNINTTLEEITPEACKSIYSLLMAAQMSGKDVRF